MPKLKKKVAKEQQKVRPFYRVHRFEKASGETTIDKIDIIEEEVLPEERDFAVAWCRGAVVDQLWISVDAELTNRGSWRLNFPTDQFERMPLFLTLELPPNPVRDRTYLLRREDNKVFGTFTYRGSARQPSPDHLL